MILAWVAFPLLLAALGLGWGALVEWGAGERELGVLAIPLGLATIIVVAAFLTSWSVTAPLAAPAVTIGGLAGLARAWRRTKIGLAPALAALGVVLVYGAPVILSGQATFLGYVRLDDTATWFALIDQLFAHGRSVSNLPLSTFQLLVNTNLNSSAYPAGSFMIPGVGRWLLDVDIARIFQPYLACSAAAIALSLDEMLRPLLQARWLRAFVAFIAAQSALLYGYAAWGGIKELTAAFLLVLGVTFATRLLTTPAPRPRATLSLAVAGAAFIVTLGPGAAIYEVPALALALVVILVRSRWSIATLARVFGALTAVTAALALPMWLGIATYFAGGDAGFLASNANSATSLGNLSGPLNGFQIAGIWLKDDFRFSLAGSSTGTLSWILIAVVLVTGAGAVVVALRRGRLGLVIYVALALAGYAVLALAGSTPWLIGKSLAISSPAILAAGMTGAALVFRWERLVAVIVGALALGAIAAGVLWSNFLQYRNVTLAPIGRLAELQTIGTMLAGEGPTFFNEYEIYGDRHYLRAGAPVEPAEYRPVNLPTLGNALLTDPAWANVDAFATATLATYRSLVIRSGPTESQPSSSYGAKPVYQGRYYELWQQPAHPTQRVLDHVPLGDTITDAYCGHAQNAPQSYLCPIAPAAVPSCTQVLSLATTAAAAGGELLAYARINPIVVRATNTRWSSGWLASTPSATLTPLAGGASATARIVLPHPATDYQLWLGGSFGRGFTVSVDGRRIGSVGNSLDPIGGYEPIGSSLTLGSGTHAITVTYPHASLSPGNADSEYYTSLFAIALSPPISQSHYITVKPGQARSLCGRSLDWIEVVAPA